MNSSRHPKYLHPELRLRWDWLIDTWKMFYPDQPVPMLSRTYRSKSAQEEAYNKGMSFARWKESLHNYNPCYALDFYFEGEDGRAIWDFELYKEFGNNAKRLGLVWGGDWPAVDGPHIQLPMTYQDAQNGRIPQLTPPDETLYGYQVRVIKKLRELLNLYA